jgi:hypothetical protein
MAEVARRLYTGITCGDFMIRVHSHGPNYIKLEGGELDNSSSISYHPNGRWAFAIHFQPGLRRPPQRKEGLNRAELLPTLQLHLRDWRSPEELNTAEVNHYLDIIKQEMDASWERSRIIAGVGT